MLHHVIFMYLCSYIPTVNEGLLFVGAKGVKRDGGREGGTDGRREGGKEGRRGEGGGREGGREGGRDGVRR